jgi:hypothetical protein
LKWIKKIFGKKEDSSEETGFREINFEDLPAWLDESYQKISSGIEKDISDQLRNLRFRFLNSKNAAQGLQKQRSREILISGL